MIINASGNSGAVDMTAENVKYGDSNVAEELNSLDQSMVTLEDELTANGTRIYLDYKDGQYGYNTSALRGADTFSPFKSGKSEFTQIATVANVAGNKLPTVNGCGYFTLRKTSPTDNTELDIYIDGLSKPFYYSGGNTLTLYFQESIRFSGGVSSDIYLYQTVLADKPVSKKYTITRGEAKATPVTISGKGKIIFTSGYYSTSMYLTLNQVNKSDITLSGGTPLELSFDNNISFYSWTSNYPVYYLAYVEV